MQPRRLSLHRSSPLSRPSLQLQRHFDGLWSGAVQQGQARGRRRRRPAVLVAAAWPVLVLLSRAATSTAPPCSQTGAGKTYTLSSIAADAIGMIPRVAAEIFSHVEGDSAHEYSVYMSYVQLYMELIQVGCRRSRVVLRALGFALGSCSGGVRGGSGSGGNATCSCAWS